MKKLDLTDAERKARRNQQAQKYAATAAGAAKIAERQERYKTDPKITARYAAYAASPRGKAVQAAYQLRHLPKVMVVRAKERARLRGRDFNITAADVAAVTPTHCPILGCELVSSIGKGTGVTPQSPSLDCVLPQLGYVVGNIQVISQRANSMKSDATFEEMVLLGQWAQRQLDERTGAAA